MNTGTKSRYILSLTAGLVLLIAAIAYLFAVSRPAWDPTGVQFGAWLLASCGLVYTIGILAANGLGRVDRLKMLKIGGLFTVAVLIAAILRSPRLLIWGGIWQGIVGIFMAYSAYRYRLEPENRPLTFLAIIGYMAVSSVSILFSREIQQMVLVHLAHFAVAWGVSFLGGIAIGFSWRLYDELRSGTDSTATANGAMT